MYSIHLTKEQYRKLIEYVYLGHWIITANKETRDEAWEDDDTFRSFLFEQAEHDGLGEYVERFKGSLVPSDRLDAAMEEEISLYEQEATWEHLVRWLGHRDLEKQYSWDQVHALTSEKSCEIIDSFLDPYEHEFEEHDIEHLVINHE